MSDHPGQQRRCPECRVKFEQADVQLIFHEDVGPLGDFYCPACGYHFARWPMEDSSDA